MILTFLHTVPVQTDTGFVHITLIYFLFHDSFRGNEARRRRKQSVCRELTELYPGNMEQKEL